jgi:hypothetical protein
LPKQGPETPKRTVGVLVTLETIFTNENASKLLKLVGLSEGIAADGTFARQARRKYVPGKSWSMSSEPFYEE